MRPEDGGAAAEHEALTKHVTLWNVAVERQIRVAGPDAERFVDYVITRDATRVEPMRARYVILCNEKGGILNDPVLRLSRDEFWFSLADSHLLYWLQGVNVGLRRDVAIDEIDVCPVQIQGPKSLALMVDLVGDAIRDIPYYGLLEAEIAGCSVVVSQTPGPAHRRLRRRWAPNQPSRSPRRSTARLLAHPESLPVRDAEHLVAPGAEVHVALAEKPGQ